MIIADEIVEKAAKARFERVHRTPWEAENETTKRSFRAGARLDIESVFSDLTAAARAEGMEEAAAIVSDLEDANFSKKPVDWVAGVLAAEIAIRSRISSLKPKTTDEA